MPLFRKVGRQSLLAGLRDDAILAGTHTAHADGSDHMFADAQWDSTFEREHPWHAKDDHIPFVQEVLMEAGRSAKMDRVYGW